MFNQYETNIQYSFTNAASQDKNALAHLISWLMTILMNDLPESLACCSPTPAQVIRTGADAFENLRIPKPGKSGSQLSSRGSRDASGPVSGGDPGCFFNASSLAKG